MRASRPPEIYGDVSIQISEIIGRTFNNPLGEYPFSKFADAFSRSSGECVLDIGAGRGRISILMAKRFGAQVVAIEPSPEMAKFANRLIQAEGMQGTVRVVQSDFMSTDLRGPFPLALSFDVISYFQDKAEFFDKIADLILRDGNFIFSDYFSPDPTAHSVQALARAWGITVPGDLYFYPNLLNEAGFRVTHFENTTPIYFAHWTEIKTRCEEKKTEIVVKTSVAAFRAYVSAIETILSAVRTGAFGHLFCIGTRL